MWETDRGSVYYAREEWRIRTAPLYHAGEKASGIVSKVTREHERNDSRGAGTMYGQSVLGRIMIPATVVGSANPPPEGGLNMFSLYVVLLLNLRTGSHIGRIVSRW